MRYRRWRKPTLLLVIALVLIWPWVMGTAYMLNLAIGAAIWGVFAVSYDLVIGWTGEISFGHSLFFGMGAYGVGILAMHTHWPTLVIIIVTIIGSGVTGFILNYLSLRVNGAYFAMVTFALAEFVYLIVQTKTSFTGGTNGLVGMSLAPMLTSPGVLYEISAVTAILAAWGVWFARRRRVGLAVHAVRDNALRAQMFGLSVRYIKAATLAAAAALAALAGALYLLYQGMAFPQTLDSNTSFTVLLMVIIGGVDSGWGPLLAGAVLFVVEAMLNATTTHWALVLGVIYVIVVRFFPKGLAGAVGLTNKQLMAWDQGGKLGE